MNSSRFANQNKKPYDKPIVHQKQMEKEILNEVLSTPQVVETAPVKKQLEEDTQIMQATNNINSQYIVLRETNIQGACLINELPVTYTIDTGAELTVIIDRVYNDMEGHSPLKAVPNFIAGAGGKSLNI
jgi:hypothetical protein